MGKVQVSLCKIDISKTVIARSFKSDKLIEDDEYITEVE